MNFVQTRVWPESKPSFCSKIRTCSGVKKTHPKPAPFRSGLVKKKRRVGFFCPSAKVKRLDFSHIPSQFKYVNPNSLLLYLQISYASMYCFVSKQFLKLYYVNIKTIIIVKIVFGCKRWSSDLRDVCIVGCQSTADNSYQLIKCSDLKIFYYFGQYSSSWINAMLRLMDKSQNLD